MIYIYTPSNADPVYPFTLTDLRRLRPDVSWPAEIDDNTAAAFNCYPVTQTDAPLANGKKAVRAAPEYVNGVWWERWSLEDYTANEVESQWASVRSDRNAHLSACDWTQLPDAPVDTAAWAEYRQALRDITEQADPFNIVWPTEPGA